MYPDAVSMTISQVGSEGETAWHPFDIFFLSFALEKTLSIQFNSGGDSIIIKQALAVIVTVNLNLLCS